MFHSVDGIGAPDDGAFKLVSAKPFISTVGKSHVNRVVATMRSHDFTSILLDKTSEFLKGACDTLR